MSDKKSLRAAILELVKSIKDNGEIVEKLKRSYPKINRKTVADYRWRALHAKPAKPRKAKTTKPKAAKKAATKKNVGVKRTRSRPSKKGVVTAPVAATSAASESSSAAAE